MNMRVKQIYERLLLREYRQQRSHEELDLASDFSKHDVPLCLRVSKRLYRLVSIQKPIIFPEDRFGFYRTIEKIPNILTKQELEEFKKKHFLFDGGIVQNISSNFGRTIEIGLDAHHREINTRLRQQLNENQREELQAMDESLAAVFLLVEKHRLKAMSSSKDMADALAIIPHQGAKTFYQSLLFLKILIYSLWLNGNKHITIGRLDQYLYPYFSQDILNKTINEEDAKNMLEEFFVSLNFDTDLYPGVQQGDNGQSLVIGGCDVEGREAFNELSRLVLEASLDLNLIDPKINMRVSKNTEDTWYSLGTELTKKGLGFPQYSNDDVVIPALVKWGYELQDARNYVVAACWEFIIPGKAMDIPNIDALNFPAIVDYAIKTSLNTSTTFNNFKQAIHERIAIEVQRMVQQTATIFIAPSPFQSILMDGTIMLAKDIADGGTYNNFGFHGAGVSNAADAIAAIKKRIFDTQSISKNDLLLALENNFDGYGELRHQLISAPKMGSNDDYVDNLATWLLDDFSDECGKYRNCRGGIFRPGTGSAMYYIWYSENLGATADGRLKGENFAANYSPSLQTHFTGVLSVVKSFTKANLERVCNGGPLTLEFHDTLFKNKEGCDKVARLVKTFVQLNGHQMQLNAVNREILLDAQKHPENHKNLIVRVWGWSGYFNELDLVYQNHIIRRTEFLN